MENKELKINAEETKVINEVVEEEQTVTAENLSNEEIENLDKVVLNITIEGPELNLLLNSLTEYISFLRQNQKRTNSIIIDEGFNKKIEEKIKKADELRYLIKKGVLIIDKSKPLYSTKDEGEVIGIETFTKTKEGLVTEESKPLTVGNTPVIKPKKVIPGDTVVQSVSEEL